MDSTESIMAVLNGLSWFSLVLWVVVTVALWKVFVKAGRPGWAAIIPFYSTWVLAEIGGKPGWWGLVAILAFLVPFLGAIVSIVLIILISLGVAKNFGKSDVFGIFGLFLFSTIGYLILGFGDAKYQAGAASTTSDLPTSSETPNTPQPPQNPPTNLVQ